MGREKSERLVSGKGGKAPALAGGTGVPPVVDGFYKGIGLKLIRRYCHAMSTI